MTVTFTVINDTKKFSLRVFNVTGKTRSGQGFSGGNGSLSLWEASLSSSYMCNREQNYSIEAGLTLFTFNLRVQPFGVNKNQFSTAHECELDDVSILIPVIVGCVLAGLIIIVVVAYLIGRRKTHAGYQSL
uniref:Lysosomal associated membrane protein 2 n=1 Tax=Tetraodon nigroviridis TaxID=99883 RepID=H3DEA2_TETNG